MKKESDNSEKLVIHGGKPVRTRPFPPQFIGANLIGKEEKELVDKVIESQSLFRHYGANCLNMAGQFEKELGEFIGTRYALALSSGSGALFCAMRGLKIGPGDEVILPARGWISDYSSIALSGAVPVFAGIDRSLNISPEEFEMKITDRTKAVIVIHYQGAASRIDEIVGIARKKGIRVIEDVAQAIGGSYNGRMLGSIGDVSIFSFQGNKVITTGDGGALATNDQEVYERAVRFHDLGLLRPTFEKKLEKPKFSEAILGAQWRMNELTAAVALAQLRKLPGIVKATREKSSMLRKMLLEEFPKIDFRDVEPENDIGILVLFYMKSKEDAAKFKEAYTPEGLIIGATTACKEMNAYESVALDLKKRNADFSREFNSSVSISERSIALTVLPVYDDNDIMDMFNGIVKVVRGVGTFGL